MWFCSTLAVVRPWRRAVGIVAGACVALALPLASAQAATALTLEEAWRLAEAANPTLRSTQARLSAAEGELVDARSFLWNNPELSVERLRRSVPQPGLATEKQRDWSAGLAQTFEVAGQPGYRREAATQELAGLQATLQETRRQVRAEIEQRFVRVLALQMRIATEAEALKLVEDAAAAVRKRVAAGEDSRLDGNLAIVEAERGRNQLAALHEQLTEARVELGSALQLVPDHLPEVAGNLMPATPRYSLEELLATAGQRPQLRALALREAAAAKRLGLERAAVYPDITVGVNVGREGPGEAREKLVGVSLSLPLPLFRRNAAGIGRATTELTQAQIERQAADRDIPAQVRALWRNVESLHARVKRLEDQVLVSLDQNQRLSVTAYRAGEIGLLQLIVVNRQVLDGRRDLIEARSNLRLRTIALEAAAGWPAAGEER